MNIFFLDEDIKKCAEYHVDSHVIKMRIELAQLACSAHYFYPNNMSEAIPYKLTHKNHPSAIWTRESIHNYIYVVLLGLELCNQMRERFGTKDQKAEKVLEWCSLNIPNLNNIEMTIPKLAFDEEFLVNQNTSINEAIENYRSYYINGKKHLHKWTKNKKPSWIN